MTTKQYELTGIQLAYRGFLLDIPRLEIAKGAAVGFTGPNGSGKSTLFRILAFLEKPSQGTVFFNGRQADEFQGSDKLKHRVTMLLQDPYLLKRSVFQNVAFGLRVRRESDLRKRVHEALHQVGLDPGKFSSKRWFELSGGEAQRVAIASRIVLNPEVIILDEPVSNVDQESVFLIKKAVQWIRKRNQTTLIISSHDRLWLNSIVDEIHILHEGRIIGSGMENIIHGPWTHTADDLWARELEDGKRIFATKPPLHDSAALLNPSEIMLSVDVQEGLSAQNVLRGSITAMTSADAFGKVRVEVAAHGITLSCHVTPQAIHSLMLYPGRSVWMVFKASSFHWQ